MQTSALRKPEMGAAVLMASVWAAIGIPKAYTGRSIDIHVFLRAAERFIHGQPLHHPSDLHMLFKYAPPVAGWFAPLSVMGLRAGSIVWSVLNALMLAHLIVLWSRRFSFSKLTFVMLPILALLHPMYMEALYGQIDLFMLWLMSVSIGMGHESSWRTALRGFGLASVALVKPPAGVVGLFFIVFLLLNRSERSKLLPFTMGALFCLLGNLLFFLGFYSPTEAWNEMQAWRHVLAETTPPWIMGKNSQGVLPLTWSFFRSSEPTSMSEVQPYLLGMALVLLSLAWTKRHEFWRFLSIGIFASAALSPIAWRANYVLALPLLGSLVADPRPTRRAWGVGMCALGLILTIVFIDGWDKYDPNFTRFLLRPYSWWSVALLVVALWPSTNKADSHSENAELAKSELK